jgi:hypothetical protein
METENPEITLLRLCRQYPQVMKAKSYVILKVSKGPYKSNLSKGITRDRWKNY